MDRKRPACYKPDAIVKEPQAAEKECEYNNRSLKGKYPSIFQRELAENKVAEATAGLLASHMKF